MKIAVLDAQGAGLGKTIIKKIKKEIDSDIYLIALGTNPVATSNMIKAGANTGITGEKDICSFCETNNPDCIIGPIGIICSGGIKGEITSSISQAVFKLECTKYIIPMQKHGIYIPGTTKLKIKDIIDEIISSIKENIEKSPI
ncbi:protein of unknown function [Paramaledivibacter caminithermalis DSM 15212]|uniref:DUF3842 family protein n=2 Tax=Paramaledivibacter TaxID=1884934 RepID=A0A1M6PIG3_PARC5|nr:protein of unknown function [Paramaledivibacter caminithermalis DSM 15212]